MAVVTLAAGPTGMSISRWVEPAASFFDMIEATICSRVSIDSGRSTEIRISSAGDRLTWPPQTRQPWQAFTTSRISSTPRSTRASTSMVSAVPAGEVMAREEVFGISQAMRGDDRHHDHRGAVAGNAADAMLVDDDGAVPFQLGAGLGHGARQRQHFAAGHEARRADEEGGDLHVGIAVMRDVVDDAGKLGVAERVSLDLGAHGIEAFRRRRRRHADQAAGGLGEAAEGGFARPSSSGATRPSSVSSNVASMVRELLRSSTREKPRIPPAAVPGSAARSPPRSRGRYRDWRGRFSGVGGGIGHGTALL